MTKAKSGKLYVNLSASQVRKRLKGHGFGVRKVESAGRNQAVIVHTATGQHLEELKALLGDVMPRMSHKDLGIPVEHLRNIGPASAQWLREVGIDTRADLEKLGPVLAYRWVTHRQPKASQNLLWALAAALADQDWRDLTAHEKEQLKSEVEDD